MERDTAWDITNFPIAFPLAEKLRLSGKNRMRPLKRRSKFSTEVTEMIGSYSKIE